MSCLAWGAGDGTLGEKNTTFLSQFCKRKGGLLKFTYLKPDEGAGKQRGSFLQRDEREELG